MTPRHLYIHAPFCARRCSYCDFAVTVDRAPNADLWLEAIVTELGTWVSRYGWVRLELQTVYVGGGTPSLLGSGVMAALRDRLEPWTSWDPESVEWTAEANPEHFSAALAADWRTAGVNRLSLGAQTFDPAALRWMGRLHGPEGPVRAIKAAREAGFENVSLDLIFGLPARLGRNWSEDLRCVIDLGPEHVSLYGLTAEPGAPLGRWVEEGREHLAGEETYAAEYLEAVERLTAAGYVHYEVSNFARPGRSSRHNFAYWTGAAYLGLGPSAHTFLPPRRFWNVRDFASYAERIRASGAAAGGEETVDSAAAELERSWLGLRTAEGLPIRNSAERKVAQRWQNSGWAVIESHGLRLTPRGWLLLDRLAVEFADALKSPEPVMTFKG